MNTAGGEKKKVMVGMSGGVDSSVAALLLLEQGYEVAGVTFRLWDPGLDSGFGESACCAVDDVNDARFVCHALGIPHYVVNYKELFKERVVDYFAREYQRGTTPNPCIACNRHIKFGAFIHKAVSMGFDYVATGHYATVLRDKGTGRYRLKKGDHAPKDQSYVLYTLTQEQLARVLMQLGPYTKEQVRAMAESKDLVVSRKAESQDICFVPDGDYGAFLEKYTGVTPPPGYFVDGQGNRLGKHRGIWHYTVGQRKGLGISFGKPMYVTAIDPAANTVTLGENETLFRRELLAGEVAFIDPDPPAGPLRLTAKIRYSAKAAPATVTPLGGGQARVVFDTPQRAAAPGQAVVFYDGDFVAGGGIILANSGAAD